MIKSHGHRDRAREKCYFESRTIDYYLFPSSFKENNLILFILFKISHFFSKLLNDKV